ncbi:hypothetical protein [Borrelia miyamotoi]|uniref:Uncharacterized protein n=1 Tax=Borrelia miyamotoi TaxID=47466 RepID=A0AAQ2WX32_9SPIR|nr:hypothetical protein [Borrelia miyamotoi]AJA58524.1 membrane protein [Borrelia miyamotoi]AOW95601.1 hypothetical protein AXH25_01725 [Borrelia miyamotoi]QTL83486.1 hypothetical protein bmLB2001_000342 [Borrelia miyamotoi]WAZ85219.1 hypothetical protein O5400_02550 [Borrelia miyamotoi]WAZ91003.1 hypothetical protein O5398_02555 [Borrelia miyamotoi]
MRRELYIFLSNFIIFLFFIIGLIFCYAYFFGADYLEKDVLVATFFDTVLSVYYYFNGFFIFFVLIYFIFLTNNETRLYLREYKGYLFKKLYPFIFLFFTMGIVFMLIFNSVMSYIFAQRSECKYNYERYNFLEDQANTIVHDVKNIDINLSSNKILGVDESIEILKQKKRYLEKLIKIYEKMKLINADDNELSMNYYLVRSEYDRMPVYDIDLEKARKTVKMYLIKNLNKKDFQDIVNGFIDKGDYSTANYFAYMGFASTKDDDFSALLDLTFKAINENKNVDLEKKYSVFEEKQKNFLYLNTGKFKSAYYGFLKLHNLFPNDNEILNYKNKSLEKLKSEYFFFDEIEKYYEHYGLNDVFLFQPDYNNGTYDYIYMQKIVNTRSYIKMIKNFELIKFDNLGNIILHIKVPFATLKGNRVYQNVLDKKNENSDVTVTRIIVALTNFNLSSPSIIDINQDINNLSLFANYGENDIFLPIQNLPSAFNQVKLLNLRSINVFSSSLFLMMSPMVLVFLGVVFITVASRVNFEFNLKFVIFLVFLIIAAFSVIISLFINYLLLILIALFIQISVNIYISFILIFSILFIIVLHVMLVNYRFE